MSGFEASLVHPDVLLVEGAAGRVQRRPPAAAPAPVVAAGDERQCGTPAAGAAAVEAAAATGAAVCADELTVRVINTTEMIKYVFSSKGNWLIFHMF